MKAEIQILERTVELLGNRFEELKRDCVSTSFTLVVHLFFKFNFLHSKPKKVIRV